MRFRARRDVDYSTAAPVDAREAERELKRLDNAYRAAQTELADVRSEIAADRGDDSDLDALAAKEYVGDVEAGAFDRERGERERRRAALRGREEQLERTVEELRELCRACVRLVFDDRCKPDRRVVDEMAERIAAAEAQVRVYRTAQAAAQARLDQLDREEDEAEVPYRPFGERMARESLDRSIEATTRWAINAAQRGLPVPLETVPAEGRARVAAAQAEYRQRAEAQDAMRRESRAYERVERLDVPHSRINS